MTDDLRTRFERDNANRWLSDPSPFQRKAPGSPDYALSHVQEAWDDFTAMARQEADAERETLKRLRDISDGTFSKHEP